MKITWKFHEQGKNLEFNFVYNMYSGKKSLHIDGEKILTFTKHDRNKPLNFIYNEEEYKLHLIPEGYGYSGKLITPGGQEIYNETDDRISYNIPLVTIPFIIINLLIPIISVEAVTPWFLALGANYFIVKGAKRKKVNNYSRYITSALISLFAWGGYYLFYVLAKLIGISGGFF